MNTEIVQLSQIRVNDANPRTITDAKFHKLVNSILSFPKMLNIRPIAVDGSGVALGGNMRYRALVFIAGLTPLDIRARLVDVSGFKEKTQGEKDLLIDYWTKWLDKPTAEIVRASNLSDAEQREFILKDNTSFGEWDYDELSSNWSETELDDWGVDVWQTEDDGSGGDSGNTENPYTQKIEAPIYEPEGEKPLLEEVYDTEKYDQLISEINCSNLPEGEKEFLKLAATRHIVFNYEKIANFYAHSESSTQELMENSALIIIDFNKAIEHGYVQLSHDITDQYNEDYETDDDK